RAFHVTGVQTCALPICMLLPVAGIECMQYRVDLGRAARHFRHHRALDPGNVVVSPSLWLWRPPLAGTDLIEVQFVLPPGVRVSEIGRAAGRANVGVPGA